MKIFIKKQIKEQLTKNSDQHLIQLILYSVNLHTENSVDSIYFGPDKEKAFYEYRTFNDIPESWFNRTDISIELASQSNKYKFIHEVDSDIETIEDYPITEYYNDSTVYELINESDWETIDLRTIEPKNKQSDILLDEVSNYFKQKYGQRKYNTINIYDEKENYKGCIQLRIADHTENIHNIDRFGSCDYYISVVISDYDATEKRFGMTNDFERKRNEFELKFSSEDKFEGVIEEIENYIDECEESILAKNNFIKNKLTEYFNLYEKYANVKISPCDIMTINSYEEALYLTQKAIKSYHKNKQIEIMKLVSKPLEQLRLAQTTIYIEKEKYNMTGDSLPDEADTYWHQIQTIICK